MVRTSGKPVASVTRRFIVPSLVSIVSLGAMMVPSVSSAVPLFARQTGFQCANCHFGGSFPELTPIGREFKLTGYTTGNRQDIPLAGMLQGGITKVNNTNGSADPATDFPHDGTFQLQQASLFTGGKIIDNLGAFVQWTYDGINHHSSVDNVDLRFANKAKIGGKDMIYGVTLNNNPTVQDVFNSTPAWSFPTAGPSAVPDGSFMGYGPSTQIDGGLSQQVVGAGAYVDWDRFLYAELSGYRTADGVFSVMRAGTDTVADRYTLSGTNPYWRLALHGDTGKHSWSVGTFGTTVDKFSDPTDNNSLTDRYKDTAIDGQYQYTDGKHKWSAQAVWIHENIDWNAGAIGNTASNSSDTLDTRRIKGSYFYNNTVGGSVVYFSNTGSQDALLYGGNVSLTPDTTGYILEVNYLPVQKIRLALQYTGYSKFNGSSSNYDGASGRNASDNDTWFLSTWFMF